MVTLSGVHEILGEQYDTGTLIDTSVYDLTSQRLLFRAQGSSMIKARESSTSLTSELTEDRNTGFDFASDMMLRNLENRLQRFNTRVNPSSDPR